ncbi:ABC transporter ATP-binding protein [Natrialba chahannaoensis]|nr:hypothetical protein [Natrialba chahannaoensis]
METTYPYTQALLSSVPRASKEKLDDQNVLEGNPPSPIGSPTCCQFCP